MHISQPSNTHAPGDPRAVAQSSYEATAPGFTEGAELAEAAQYDVAVVGAGREATRRLWTMAEEGKRILKERTATDAIDCTYLPGSMYTAVKPADVRFLQEMLSGWQALGHDAALWLGSEETRALVDCPHYLGGISDAENGHLHPLRYTSGLARGVV